MSRRRVLALGWLALLALTAILPLAAIFHGIVHFGPGSYRSAAIEDAPVIAIAGNVALPRGAHNVVVVVAGNAYLGGVLRDDVVTLDGNVYLGGHAVVERDVLSILGTIYRGPGVHSEGRLGGAVQSWDGRSSVPGKNLPALLTTSARLGLAAGVALLLIGTCLTVVFPWQVILIATTLRSAPVKSGAAGVMALLCFIFLVVPLGLNLAGLPFAILLSGAGFLAWLFGLTSCAIVLGRLVARRTVSLVWAAAAGLVALAAVLTIPVAGPLVITLAGLSGSGALIVAMLGRSRPATL